MRCLIGVLVGKVSAVTAGVLPEVEATSSIRLRTGASSLARLLPATEPVDVKVAATTISAAVDSKADFSFRFFIFFPIASQNHFEPCEETDREPRGQVCVGLTSKPLRPPVGSHVCGRTTQTAPAKRPAPKCHTIVRRNIDLSLVLDLR